MKHVQPELDAYLDRALAPQDRARVESHLEVCGDCRTALARARDFAAALGDTRAPDPGAAYWSRFAARVETRLERHRSADPARGYERWTSWLFPRGRFAWVRAAGAVATVTLVTYIGMRGFRPESLRQVSEVVERERAPATVPNPPPGDTPPAPQVDEPSRLEAEAPGTRSVSDGVSPRSNVEVEDFRAAVDPKKVALPSTVAEETSQAAESPETSKPSVALPVERDAVESSPLEGLADKAERAAAGASSFEDARIVVEPHVAPSPSAPGLAAEEVRRQRREAQVRETLVLPERDLTYGATLRKELKARSIADPVEAFVTAAVASDTSLAAAALLRFQAEPAHAAVEAEKMRRWLVSASDRHVRGGRSDRNLAASAPPADGASLLLLYELAWPRRHSVPMRPLLEVLAARLASGATDAGLRLAARETLAWLVATSATDAERSTWQAKLDSLPE